MTDILIADKGGKIGEAVAESLRRHGLSVEIFDDAPVFNDRPGYIRTLKQFVLQCRPRMIIPVFKASWLAAHRDEFEHLLPIPNAGTVIPLADASLLEMLDDKVRCSGLAANLGISQPGLYQDGQFDMISRWPVVFKRASGLSGSSVYFPKDRHALDNLVKSSPKAHLVMDYIEGYDVSVDLVRWPMGDGRVFRQAAAYRVLWPRKKGIPYIRIGVARQDIVAEAERLLDAVDYRGVCGMDFRVDRSGKAFFLECNPRFSGGIRSSMSAGLDLPYLLWQLANGEWPQIKRIRRYRISIG